MKILQVNSAARTVGANSTQIADSVTARLIARHPSATVEVLDLAANPHPALDQEGLGALFTPAEDRSEEQHARVEQDNALIAQVQAADVLVLGVPMYNFAISSQLKNWIDAIAKAGVTFRYTEKGPEGLLKGKKVYVALARGGIYRDTANDTQVPYLKMILGFLGMTDVDFIYAEGFAMGAESIEKALASAEAQVNALIG
ncbi:FMN-dependent NADH-azoreductase [Zwartia sp.]|uniref:FMN-dependent NADH-azoreductase n=1 Tax=Zwartia sp. TaxID=2978004 RepID=UPI003BAFDBA7